MLLKIVSLKMPSMKTHLKNIDYAPSPLPIPLSQVSSCFHEGEQRKRSLIDLDYLYFVIETKIEVSFKMM